MIGPKKCKTTFRREMKTLGYLKRRESTTKFIDTSLLGLPARKGQDVIMMGVLSALYP